MSNQVQAVKFYDDTLITLEKDGEHYVAVRPIVENMGLDWARQSTKLKNPKFNCCHMPTVAQDGKIREVLCMPIKKLNGWLFSINPEKVRSDIRHIVEQYQEECFAVLHDYWHKGVAVNERATTAPVCIAPQTLTELAPITPFKSHMSAADSQAVIKEMQQVYNALVPLIRQVADCYYDKQMAFSQIEATIEHYCGVKNSHWITLERLPTALTVLSIMKNEATAHKKMMHRLDDNARLALSYKTVNAIGYTGETFDDVEV
ncbi:phage antirepressor N-terminal domain-containing protein [Moraxella bovis]|uniref:P22_AR N-terminal domain n=1 Tax=Moraxella bovis TaxID=476 RepID=A0A378PYI4_MORBO|nr:phage antirepressor N-terminal domain-containing protein [Moraxella bovis]STY93336.1 P22_AR N-terminal domain [Moraxella bovis]